MVVEMLAAPKLGKVSGAPSSTLRPLSPAVTGGV